MSPAMTRIQSFCDRFGLRVPILLAPMAGASAPSLSIAVIQAGGLGACGALLMSPEEILSWANEVRTKGNGPFQINLWIPEPPPRRDPEHERRVREFLPRGVLLYRPTRAMPSYQASKPSATLFWRPLLPSCRR